MTPEDELEELARAADGYDETKFTGFIPGLPDDLSTLPVLHYQALMGRVYTIKRWSDGSTVRGEVPLKQLEMLVGGSVKEGWYDALGEWLGMSLPMEDPPEEPTLARG